LITKILTTTAITFMLLPAPTRLVIFTPEGREPQNRAAILAAWSSALGWWGMEKSTPSVSIEALPPDALNDVPVYPEGTVVVLETDGLLMGKYRGLASPGRIWVVSSAFNLPAVFAHEVGHAYFGLEHWEDCIGLDIMCDADQAYAARSVGCRSLSALGRPCAHEYLPFVEAP
jgi:hypothetical protein